jgi:mono/diheme cytochrome c family protein
MQQSVRFHARDIAVPAIAASPQAAARGAALYAKNCQQCHGGPGVAMDAIGMSMQPVPGPLADAARRWKPSEMFWITANGIKMSGMPAWRFHLAEREIWEIVAFLGALPSLTQAQYAAIAVPAEDDVKALGDAGPIVPPLPAPDRVRGKLALTQYACQSCHLIPGVTGPLTHVGPRLDGLAGRSFIAGKLPTSQENLVHWIRAPQETKPGTTMPHLNVTERDARDMAAYLLEATR